MKKYEDFGEIFVFGNEEQKLLDERKKKLNAIVDTAQRLIDVGAGNISDEISFRSTNRLTVLNFPNQASDDEKNESANKLNKALISGENAIKKIDEIKSEFLKYKFDEDKYIEKSNNVLDNINSALGDLKEKTELGRDIFNKNEVTDVEHFNKENLDNAPIVEEEKEEVKEDKKEEKQEEFHNVDIVTDSIDNDLNKLDEAIKLFEEDEELNKSLGDVQDSIKNLNDEKEKVEKDNTYDSDLDKELDDLLNFQKVEGEVPVIEDKEEEKFKNETPQANPEEDGYLKVVHVSDTDELHDSSVEEEKNEDKEDNNDFVFDFDSLNKELDNVYSSEEGKSRSRRAA